MALERARSGQVIGLDNSQAGGAEFSATALVKTEQIELIRLVLPAGKELAEHHVKGEITFQCLHGEIAFISHGHTVVLTSGTMLYLEGGAPHAVRAIKDSVALVTIVLRR